VRLRVHFLLEGRRLLLGAGRQFRHLPKLGLLTDSNDQRLPLSVEDHRPGEDSGRALRQLGSRGYLRLGVLGLRGRLPCEGRFVHQKSGGENKASVGSDPAARLQGQHIPHDYLCYIHFPALAIAEHRDLWRLQFVETRHRPVGASLVIKLDADVDENHHRHNDGFTDLAQEEGNTRHGQ